MTFSETIEGAVASLFFFDKATQSKSMYVTEDNYNYGPCGWYIVLGFCLFLGLKVMIKRYFSSKKANQTEITQKRKYLGAPLREILRHAFRIAVDGTKTINAKNQVDPMRSIQLPRTIRKSLQEKLQAKTLSTSRAYHVHANMGSPQLAVISTAEVSKITEQSSPYQDAMSISRLSVKGQYVMKGSPKMSSQIPPETSVRRSGVALLHSADVALEVGHSLSQGHIKLSPPSSQKQRCQQLDVMQPQDTNGILTQEEEVLDCNIRCAGDHEPDRKLPLYLTYPKGGKVSQKMRSMFSRSRLATECRSEQRAFDDLRFEDGSSCCTFVSRLPEEEINTTLAIPETLKATTSKAKQTCDILGQESRHVHDISQIESQRPAATSGVKKKSVKHVCKEKGYGVGSLDDMYTSLMCLNKTHKAMTAPFAKNEDFHDGSNPARRKWQEMYKDTLEAVDLSYRSCPSKAPRLLEIFAPGAFQQTDTAKIDRHCQIREANFENRRALQRNRRIRLSKDEHGESMAMDIFEIVATQMQPTDFKNTRSSKIRFARKRKRICSGLQKNVLESNIKEDCNSLVGKKNDTCSSFAGTDVRLSLQNRMVLQGTKGGHICHSIKEYDIHPTATELNLAKHDHIKYHQIPVIRGQEMPQRSNVHKQRRRKSNTTALPLFDQGPESIRMVESLFSVTAARPTHSSMMLSLADPSICRKLVSKRSSVSSISDAETLEPLNIPTASTPDHVKIDLLKMPKEEETIGHKQIVKKSLRFAAATETLGVSIPMPSAIQTPPSAWSESEKVVNPVSDSTVDSKVDNKSKTQKKRAKSSCDDQKLFDKLVLQNKDDIKNVLRLCQSVESRVCDKISVAESQSPISVRIQNIRSRTRRYPTLTSFLDRIEKKNNVLKDRQSQVVDQKGPAFKNSVIAAETKRAAKDPIVTQEEEIAMIACPNKSKVGSGVREYATEGTKNDYIYVCPCSNLTTVSDQQQTQKQDANLGLHFGTDSLQLYSESVDSVRVVKKDNKTVRDAKGVLPHQSRTGSCAKQQHVMKNVPASNSGSLQKLRRPTKEAEPFAPPTATEKADLKFLRQNSFRTIKKDVSKETNTRENNSLHKVMYSVQCTRKRVMGREHLNQPQPCTKNGALSSTMKLQSNPKYGNTQSLHSFADPSRRPGSLAETEWSETGDRDSPKVSDARKLTADCRTDELAHAIVNNAAGNIDTFREIINMEQHPVKSPMSGKSTQLSSLNRSRSIELSSPCWVCAVGEVSDSTGQIGTPQNEVKTMYPCNNTISSPLNKMPLILKTEDIKNIALESLQVDNTPPRIRKRIRRLKTCSLGHVISKLSEAEIKPPRSDAFRDTDLSSTSKSLASIDINGMRTTQNMVTGTTDKMPVIVKKLLVDSTKRQSYDSLGTSCEKQNSPHVEPASPVHNLVPASFSRNQQPLQSIRRGSLKDIFDRYVVHTSEHPQRHAARITGKPVRHPRTGESDVHCSLTDLDASTRSPTATSCRVRPDVSQRNISSYTSKYRANDSIDKSVRSPWRGTVAFRKRLQHLLQHNKHIQNKYRHINMTAKKTSPVNISTSKVNSVPASKDKLEDMYKVSRIVRPCQVPNHISDVKHETFMGALEAGNAGNIYAACTVVTPVSTLLDVRDEFVQVIVDSSNKELTVHSVKSPLQDKTTDEENSNVPMIPSPIASHPLETSAHPPPQKVIHSSRNIITHSDHFEQKSISQVKRHKETLERKLKQTRGNFETKPLSNVTLRGTSAKPSAPCYVSSRRAFSSRPRVPWLHEQPRQVALKPLETMPSVAEPGRKQRAAVDEQAKLARDVADSPRTTIPSSQRTSNSEGAVPETATGKLRSTMRVVGLDSGQSIDSSDIQAEVTRCDFFTPEQQFVSAGDTPLAGTTKKEMTRVSETEHNLQLLLDKIKHRSSLTPIAGKDKEKENIDVPAGIVGKPDINIHNKQTQHYPKLDKNQQSAERNPQSVSVMENVPEQTKSNFKTDKKAAAGVTCERFPPSSCRVEKGITTSHKSGDEINKMHEGKRKTYHRTATKAVSKTESTVKNRRQSMMADKSSHTRESHDSSKTDEKAKLSARKIMYNKYKLMPRNKAKKATSSLDKMTKPGNENSTTSVSNLKHVAFNLHGRLDKSNTESYGTITSEAASQVSSENCINPNDTEVFHSRAAKTAPLRNKVRQTMSVLNILNTDEAERVGKNAPRQDVQLDQASDISHTNEKQQSSTEATGKLLCSSGYGTMDTSTTSFSQLQNSSNVEPGKLAVEPVTAREVCSPGSYSEIQHGAYDHAVLHVCKQGELFHESFERVPQAGSLTSFWKKELHMDVIPEEADHENGVDSQTDKDSAKSKLTESEMKKYEIEEKGMDSVTGKEHTVEIADTGNAGFSTVNKAEVENMSSEHDTVYIEQCQAGQETEDPMVNIPVPARDFDENYIEMRDDVTESPMETLNKRNGVTDTRTRELSVPDAEDIVWNHCNTVSEHSPPNDTCVPEQVDRDALSSPHLDQAVAETISQMVGTHTYLTNLAPENDSCASRLHPKLVSERLDIDVQNTTLDCPRVTPEEEARCDKIHEVNDLMSSGNDVAVAKESSSFSTEPKSERPKLSNHHLYSSMFAKTLEHYRQVSHSKSDSTATKHEAEVGDFISTTEVSKQSMFLGEKNKSDLSTVRMKSTICDIQETKSVSSVAEQSYSSSDNSLSQGVFQCTDDLGAASRKPQYEEINPHNTGNTHKGDTNLKKVSQTSSILRNVVSSSQTELPNSDDDSTFQKLSEPSTANNLAQGDSTISQNKPSVGDDLPFGDKLIPDTNRLSLASNSSDATTNGRSRNAPFRMPALDRQPTAETQTTEFDVYNGDGVRAVTQTSEFDVFNGDGVRAVTQTSEFDVYNGDGVRAVTQTSEFDVFNGDGVRAVTQTSESDIYYGDGVRALTQTSEFDVYSGDGFRAVTQTSEFDVFNGDGVREVTQTSEFDIYNSDGVRAVTQTSEFDINSGDGVRTVTQTSDFDVYNGDGARAVTQTSEFDIYNGNGVRTVTQTSEFDVYNGDGARAVTQTSEFDIYNGNGVRAVTQTSEFDIYNGDGVRAVTQTSEFDIYNGDGVRAVTQTSEFDIYNGDGVRAVTQTGELGLYTGDGAREQKSVGLQVEYTVDEENAHSPKDRPGWNGENIPEAAVSPISSEVEVTKIEKYRSKKSSDTKMVLSSGGRKDKPDENDAPAETVIREQNVNVTKEIPIPIVEVNKEEKVVAQDTRRRAHHEGISQSVTDDLESLLNKELSQVNAAGGLKQGCEVNRLFGTYYDRNTRKEKRRRRSEQTLKQLPSQRELHYHFVRENDGSVKRTSSNTSQQTAFSPSDTGTQHSSRAIRPLALGRVTKLEEFLQKAEETNRSETTSNMSRAVSKLSSFTSVTPSSQEEQLTPLKCQTRRSNKAAKFKQKASETEGNRSHETSEINTTGGVSGKSSQFSRIKNIKSNRLHGSQISENQHEDNSCEYLRYTSNNDQSPFQDCVSDCTGNNDDSRVTADVGGMLNRTESHKAEQVYARTYSNEIPSAGYSLHAEITLETTRAGDNMQGWITSTDTGPNTYLIQNEASVNMRVTEAVGPSNHASKYTFAQHQQPIANIAPAQAMDECSALSSSSSSIVLSWIGSDLGDPEEIIQTPNFTDQEDKLYSDDATELNNYHLHGPQANEAREFPIVTDNAQLLYPEYQSCNLYTADASKLWRSSVSDSVPHLTPISGIILQESTDRMPGYRLQHDSNVASRVPHPGGNVGHSKLTRLKQNEDILPADTSLPSTEHALFETHKKEAKHTDQPRLPSNNYLQCDQNETFISSPASSKAPKTISAFWNNNPKECTLEQPSYFNSLLRDPKWNPSFEIKEVSNKVGHQSEETGAAGSYVQSAWVYQRVRHMSPTMFPPQTGQECNSSMYPHSVQQQHMAHEKPDAHVVSSISAQRPNTNISFDMCSIHSNQSDPRSHRYAATHTPPRNAFIIQCSRNRPAIQHSEQDQEGNTRITMSQDFATRGIIKQDTFLRKVHFDGNFKPDQIGPVYAESTSRPDSQSWAIVHGGNNKSTQQLSLDKHLKTSARTGAVPVTCRLPSEQRSQGTESTKTKTKMSLEQHLCSTFDTDRNSVSNAAQHSSENGTTKSTSSHASLNWYKPQSLPSSTSVSNGNTSHGHQETSAQQEPSHRHERSPKPRTPHSELGITKNSRRSTSGSARRQDTHTLEHIVVNSPNHVPSLSSSTHGKTSAQHSRKCSPGTQHNLLAQTLIPSLVPRVDKGSSESLSTPSSASAHNSSKNHVPGFCWLRDPSTSGVTRHTLPCGNTRVNGNKSTRRLANTSNQSRGGSKTSNDREDRTLANQARGLISNGRKPHTLSNNRSCYTSHFNTEKKPEVNTVGECETSSGHIQSVKRTRGSSARSATNRNSEPRSGAEDLPDTTTNGGTLHGRKPLSAHLSDGGASESHHPETDPASPFQGARRVSKLVEMFEKKRAS